jgi:hypothetical protein
MLVMLINLLDENINIIKRNCCMLVKIRMKLDTGQLNSGLRVLTMCRSILRVTLNFYVYLFNKQQ